MYKFSNSHYERTHGKAPKERGVWGFEINGEIEFIFGGFTLTEAKKRITETLKGRGVPAGTTVYVAP